MFSFAIIKIVRAIITLWAVMTFAFVFMRLTGDPARELLPDNATEEVIALFRARWRLDQTLWTQYVVYLNNLMHGDFGQSLANGREALTVVLERLPATLTLTGTAFALVLAIGIPGGIIAALNRGRPLDQVMMLFCSLGYSLPNFVLGVTLIFFLAVGLRLLPSSGSATPAHLVMPVITLGFSGAAVIARFTRSAVLEVLEQPYVRAAIAAGETRRQAILNHVLPNAAIPIVTIIGFSLGGLVGGSIIVEQVFGWPGVGRLLVDVVGMRDLAVVQALVMLFATTMTLANLSVDLAYGFLNPKIRRRH
ncbi:MULTISPECIES: ABC transporter permease [unclassified Chelatococcus]|uniref:ABC transporter permease n=1 Tax=unclassified Chelatococcus TaxID=2638111 RepID=UPI001BCD98C4|nr:MULTISPECIES: ABC transporter permease [unclassified Chelatococcus]MBS7696112.1 ABC transporter permease [Chelatococcus sp. YT9]MBX3557861.1 ABC transporter permease [Chelatococcus sp.]